MKMKLTILLAACTIATLNLFAQDEEKPGLSISGSVDTYWKYDFSGFKNDEGTSNIPTSFADQQNSVSIGMLDIAISQTIGKASFVGEFSFGPRSFKSIPTFQIDGEDDININIQNLLVTYAFTEKISLTAGYMGTFVGYEVISPVPNFNYSTSYLFSFGPFQNAGLRFDWTVLDNLAIMVGIFDDWNVYQDFNGVSDIGAQVYWAPVGGLDMYLNFITGSPSGTILDLTASYQVTDKFFLGLNAADYSAPDDGGGYSGVALYPQFAFSDLFSLGLRTEYFNYKGYALEQTSIPSEHVFSNTLTGNFNLGPMRFLAEVRLDDASSDFFYDKNTNPRSSASQFLLAAIYAF
jgi:hypothetical protein